MQKFEFQGFSGLLLMFLMVSVILFFVVIFPSMIFTALWNATIYGMMDGMKIGLLQGAMVWALVVMSYLLWFTPDIQIKFAHMNDINEADKPPTLQKKLKQEEPKPQGSQHSEHWRKWRKAQEDVKKNEKTP